MITLNNFTKLDNNQYQMVLSMKKTDSVEELPSETRPMSPEYFAVTVDYGVPADGSIVIKESGEVLAYSAGEWNKTGTAGDIKLKELSVEENGEYLPESGYVGFNKVMVDVQPKIVMPVKGDIITLDGKQYRVLKVNDTVAEVSAMYNATDSQKLNASGDNNIYADSSLDIYLSQTFYNSLNTSLQNAIVVKTFQQDEWSWTSGTSGGTGNAIYQGTYDSSQYRIGLTNASYGTSISRKCYVLSIQDVIDYLEVTTSMDPADTTLTSENIWKMFWNQTASPGSIYPWLRSANNAYSNFGFMIGGGSGYISAGMANFDNAVCPAFQIDLSKIDWTKSE